MPTLLGLSSPWPAPGRYQFDLAGVGSTDGPGAVGRFGIGAVALALAIGVLLGRRRG